MRSAFVGKNVTSRQTWRSYWVGQAGSSATQLGCERVSDNGHLRLVDITPRTASRKTIKIWVEATQRECAGLPRWNRPESYGSQTRLRSSKPGNISMTHWRSTWCDVQVSCDNCGLHLADADKPGQALRCYSKFRLSLIHPQMALALHICNICHDDFSDSSLVYHCHCMSLACSINRRSVLLLLQAMQAKRTQAAILH